MSALKRVKVRKAKDKDYGEVNKLFEILDSVHIKLLPSRFQKIHGPARAIEVFEEKLRDARRCLFVAVLGKRVIGMVDIRMMISSPQPLHISRKDAFIDYLVVIEELWSHGVAQMLFDRARKWATARKLMSLQLTAYCANERALCFYQTLGMKPLSITLEVELQHPGHWLCDER